MLTSACERAAIGGAAIKMRTIRQIWALMSTAAARGREMSPTCFDSMVVAYFFLPGHLWICPASWGHPSSWLIHLLCNHPSRGPSSPLSPARRGISKGAKGGRPGVELASTAL